MLSMASCARMARFTLRPLTEGEIAVARDVFGATAAWRRVRVVQLPKLGFGAMAPFKHTILFSSWAAAADFSVAPLEERAWFVHELTHIWQAARGVSLPLAKLSALGKRAYAYKPVHEIFARYNIEAQAEIARHLFLARHGVRPHDAPSREWLETVFSSASLQSPK
jgi:hypothetical protein